jgi:hypothetical protein
MLRSVLGAWLVLACVPALQARDDTKDKPKPDKPGTPAEQVKAITEEFNQAQQDFFKLYNEAKGKTDQERQKLVEEKYPRPDKYAERLMKVAEDHPKDPAAVTALIWVVQQAAHTPRGNKALEIFAKDHIADKEIGSVCLRLAYSASPTAEKLLRAVREKNPDHEAQGQATYALAQYLHNNSRRGAPAGADQARQSAEAEKFYEETASKYGDVQVYGRPLAGLAKVALFEIRHLAIGKIAPEIEGEDIDAKPMKLSDYRGKVVVLDFWGNW